MTSSQHQKKTVGKETPRDSLPAPSAADRRVRAGVNVLVYVVALLVVVVLLNALVQRFDMRLDVTRNRRYSLSPRTQAILSKLVEPVELALVIEPGVLSDNQFEDLLSILRAYDRAGGSNLNVTEISAAAVADVAKFDELVHRLQGLYAEQVAEIDRLLEDALQTVDAQAQVLKAGRMRVLSALAEIVEESDASAAVRQYLSLLENHGQVLVESAAQTREILSEGAGGVPIPDYDAARTVLSAGMEQPTRLTALFADYFEFLAASPTVSASGRERFATLAQLFRSAGDDLAVAREALMRPGPLELSEIVRDMQSSNYLLMVGRQRATILPLATLFPADRVTGKTRRFAGEETVAVVLASLTLPEPPLVFFLHAERQSLFGSGSQLINTAQRLSGQRLRLAEWSVAQSAEPPQIPFPNAPRVYIVLPPAVSSQDGLERQANLAAVVTDLVDQGENLLYHLPPSTLPGAGQVDVNLRPIAPLGIGAHSGLEMVLRTSTPDGPVIGNEMPAQRAGDEHLISQAMRDLPTTLIEATPLTITDEQLQVTRTPILQIDSEGNRVWAESDWFAEQWRTATPEGRRDLTDGPFLLAATAERLVEDGSQPQRVVVVGAAPIWLNDAITGQVVNGVLASPGNAEFLDASVYWLAHLDHLVKPGAAAVETPRIASNAPTRLVGWLVIAVMPGLALVCGFVITLMRRRA